MNFYKHFIGDYSRSTGDLSILEHGAYRLMLDHFYGAARPLPKERKALYRLLRAESDQERRAVDTICLRYWRPLPDGIDPLYQWLKLHKEEEKFHLRTVAQQWAEPGGLVNVRALGELVKAQAIAEKNRKIAIDREAARRAKLEEGRAQ